MDTKIFKIYCNITKCIIKKVEGYNINKKGRHNKFNYDIYLKKIFYVLINGLSWNNLSKLLNINCDLFRKKYKERNGYT